MDFKPIPPARNALGVLAPEELPADRRVFRETWLAAARAEDSLVLSFPTTTSAQRARFQLYSFAKPYKENPAAATIDPELVAAVLAISISLQPDKKSLLLQYGSNSLLAEALSAATGIDLEALERERVRGASDKGEDEAEESLRRLQGRMADTFPELGEVMQSFPNPFARFTRQGDSE